MVITPTIFVHRISSVFFPFALYNLISTQTYAVHPQGCHCKSLIRTPLWDGKRGRIRGMTLACSIFNSCCCCCCCVGFFFFFFFYFFLFGGGGGGASGDSCHIKGD